MNRSELSGIRGDSPIGVMAAFGCLRICSRIAALAEVRLSWDLQGGIFRPVLWTGSDLDKETLVRILFEAAASSVDGVEWAWSDQIKSALLELYTASSSDALNRASGEDREAPDWFSAFACDLVTSEGLVESTPFDMTVARQRFLADARKLSAGLSDAGKGKALALSSMEEALFGPWRYADDQHSLGWDSSTMKLGAFTHKKPTAMANSGVRAAVWLALQSLPLFPCFYSAGLQTRSFSVRNRGRTTTFHWPIWNPPISYNELKVLLGSAVPGSSRRDAALASRGVVAIYRSEKFKPNKYLAFFRPAELAEGSVPAGASAMT